MWSSVEKNKKLIMSNRRISRQSGLKLAVLYGFHPHRLGFCGAQKESIKKTLLDYLTGGKIPEQKIRKILKTFKAAFSYYKLIAESNKISDVFDEKVVRAYWIGNQLLEKVPIGSLRKMIIKEFSKPGFFPLKLAEKKAKRIPFVSKPHHSFHVLIVGALTDRLAPEDKSLDLCRIGWGKVREYKKTGAENRAVVEYQPLQKRNKRYFLGKPVHRFVFWDKNLIPEVRIGDIVTTHWGHIVQIIDKRNLANLKKYTHVTIKSLSR